MTLPETPLEQLEARVSAGLLDALDALAEIHDRRLYLAHFASFDDYCRERWGFSGRAGIRKIRQAAATKALPPGSPVPSQRELERGTEQDDATYPSMVADDHSSNAPDVISLDVSARPLDTITPDAVLPPEDSTQEDAGGPAIDPEEHYCGCCGVLITGTRNRPRRYGDPLWCKRCRPHIDNQYQRPIWERTYFAATGTDCPFQV